MLRALFVRRWSTVSLLIISAGLSALAYFAGRISPEKTSAHSAVSTDASARIAAHRPTLTATPAGTHAGENRSTAGATTDFDERWRRSSTRPRTPDSEREMAAALEALATQDSKRAMALALSEGNVRLRQNLRNAVLRGWASQSPDDATTWALALPDGDRQLAIESVFAGAAHQPDAVARLGARLCAQYPDQAGDYGQYAITALTEAGAYETAVRFAAADTSANRTAWLNAAFFQWASHQPQQALLAFGGVSDPARREAAFQGMVLGWAMADPSSLVTYAMKLPPGENRAQALGQALPQWVGRDTLVASEWINQLEPGPDLDAGVAAVATLPNLVNQRPEIAIGWAESIAEPVLRANTLRTVAQQWAQRDPAGLRRFLSDTTNLLPADRTALLDGLNPPPDA